MKKEEFTLSLMDKLAGELSENEAKKFETEVAQDEELSNDFDFFSQAWEDLDRLDVSTKPSASLSENFYARLHQEQWKKENSFQAKVKRLASQIYSSSPLARNLSFGLFLLAFGFILGGRFNTKTTHVKQTIVQQQPQQIKEVVYIPSTEKLQQMNHFNASTAAQVEPTNTTEKRLKDIVMYESNTNVRLAALSQLGNLFSNDESLKKFYIHQLEREHSPLIQVELLNLIIENSKTKESIQTMETFLSKQKLSPVVAEKIKKDLPVLRASYIQR